MLVNIYLKRISWSPRRGAKAAGRRAIGGPSRGLPIMLMVLQAFRLRRMPPA